MLSAAKGSQAPDLPADVAEAGNFVEDIVVADLEQGTHEGRVCTRFPPEPNGHLHIGHAKSIFLNFGVAGKFKGVCHLRFDDTNPTSEKKEFIDSIQEDVRWLGVEWHGPVRYASDYFDQLYEWAVAMIQKGLAYVDELSPEEISAYRGTLTSPGKDSPYRDRPIEESLEIFEQMRTGALKEQDAVLRAKIDMAHPNVIMRDPIMYRILKSPPHPRTQDKWCIYPSYDWAHGLSDAIEGITHSVCTLEFSSHNELYNWFNESVQGVGGLEAMVLPRQYEFARLEMTNVVVSKRKLKRLIDGGVVEGWNDPRMPTLSGMRRRGYPADALKKFCGLIGVTKVPTSVINYSLLEYCVREVLAEQTKLKLLCVLRPLRIVVTNWDESEEGLIEIPAEEPGLPARRLPFGREVLIDREDFMLEPVRGFKRLSPGKTVKLRYAYTLTCEEVVQGDDGEIEELHCTYDPDSLGKRPPKKVGVVHWVHATESEPVHVRLYEPLFLEARPEESDDFIEAVNPNSVEVLEDARCEPRIADLHSGDSGPLKAQFERVGYFVVDEPKSKESQEDGGPLVFNRTAPLSEGWKPAARKQKS